MTRLRRAESEDTVSSLVAPIITYIARLTWTPKTEPALIRASLSARLGQEKPHDTQAPHPRADQPQPWPHLSLQGDLTINLYCLSTRFSAQILELMTISAMAKTP